MGALEDSPTVWLIEREFICPRRFAPIKGEVYGSKEDAQAGIKKMECPHLYVATAYHRKVQL